jgi:hypothetical protein
VNGIIKGCQAANNGNPCVWLTPDAIPGVHRGHAVAQFSLASNSSDDFSDRIADVLVGDIDGDSFPDVLVPRSDGIYCATNTGNGTLYSLQRCVSFADSSMVSGRYWLVDVDGDNMPYVVWLNSTGMVGVKADGKGGFGSETRLLSADLSESRLHSGSIDRESIRFGRIRSARALPDVVAMSSSGVVVAVNNGHGFNPIHSLPHLAYQGKEISDWCPEQAGKHMALVDLFGTGTLDIVVPGDSSLLYARAGKDGLSAFKPLIARDGFDYWSSPRLYTSLNATKIAGRTAIAGWTPMGIATSDLKIVGQRATLDSYQVLCSDCYSSLPGWQQSIMNAAAFQSGFADFKGSGTPQAFVVWGPGLFVGVVDTLAGYK